jgi:hypothetical protein
MKKKLVIIVTALTLISGSGFVIAKNTSAKTPVNKNINVEVYKTASYASPAYADATASLEVTVVRVKDNKKDTVWQHAFKQTELKDYPASDKPITQRISVPNVNDRKEKLEIYYNVKYNSKGSILDYRNIQTIGQGQQTGKLNIQI